jgi:rhamnose utilization protein RhaD (predicted bifunctional aldolase and dehydrogenase)
MTMLERDIKKLCTALGRDPLLVQGAGGNVSWKEGDTLWIKGSGTWLANAEQDDIFVPVKLPELSCALMVKDFNVRPQLICEHTLRPSIETTLHALMPQTIVIHLHAIHALTYLIYKDSQKIIGELFDKITDERLHVAFVQYHKPGPYLARAVQEALINKPNANIVFLKNHGIVIGADTIGEIKKLLDALLAICAPEEFQNKELSKQTLPNVPHELTGEYECFADINVQALAINLDLYKRLESDWALFPDHVVFLGPKAFTYSSWDHFLESQKECHQPPELIFIKKIGVFNKKNGFSLAKSVQLRCYYDLLSYIKNDASLSPLNADEVEALLTWDAEKLRQQMSN